MEWRSLVLSWRVVPGVLKPRGRVLMAISPVHVDPDRLRDLISWAGLRVERLHRLPLLNTVYVLVAGDLGEQAAHRQAGSPASASAGRKAPA